MDNFTVLKMVPDANNITAEIYELTEEELRNNANQDGIIIAEDIALQTSQLKCKVSVPTSSVSFTVEAFTAIPVQENSDYLYWKKVVFNGDSERAPLIVPIPNEVYTSDYKLKQIFGTDLRDLTHTR